MVTLEEALDILSKSGKPSSLYFDPRVMKLEIFQSKIESKELMKGRIIVTSEIDMTSMKRRVYTVMQFTEDYTQIERISKPGQFATLEEALDYAREEAG